MDKEEFLQKTENIRYLIKFVLDEYVEYLLCKGLFMNQVNYFVKPRKNEDGQYDCWESLSSGELKLYKNRNRPIWCSTAILTEDIDNGVIKLDKRLLTDFFKDKVENGIIVLIEFKQFINKIFEYPDEYEINFGLVQYYEHVKQIGEKTFSEDWSDTLFLKSKRYNYQKEFRVAINRACEIKTKKRKVFRFYEVDAVTSYEPYKYSLPNLNSISKVYKTSELEVDDNYLYLKV